MEKFTKINLSQSQWILLSIACLSTAVFLFEITLTRLFSIAHFYHFAFIVVTLALLGNGSSGTFLTIFPIMKKERMRWQVALMSVGCSVSILGGYLFFNRIPFDSYAVAIDPLQLLIFLGQLLVLSLPFFFTGLCVNGSMKNLPAASNRIYAVNLIGSALGCLLAPLILPVLGGPGVICVCIILAVLPGLGLSISSMMKEGHTGSIPALKNGVLTLVSIVVILATLPTITRYLNTGTENPLFRLYVSPYKSLSYALQYPGATIRTTRWNAFSRVDIVQSDGIRSLPGLSYLYPGTVASKAGIFVDGDNLSPILSIENGNEYAAFLPQALVYQLRPSANTLVMEPRSGLDLIIAHAGGASLVTAVEPNPIIISEAGSTYNLPNIKIVNESPRSFLVRGEGSFDAIVFSLSSTYHPVTSGAYSLGEEYKYTLEAVTDALESLNSDGFLVLGRWLQVPPSEFLRAFILVVDAMENSGMDPQQQIAAIRGYNLGTLFVKKSPLNGAEINEIRAFAENRAFDLVYLPGIQSADSNRFNILPDGDLYFQAFTDYLFAKDRKEWLNAYPYDVSPPTDNRPFFEHFFKWSQVDQALAAYGKTWQPFGGAGYLVILFLLVIVVLISLLLILGPLLFQQRKKILPSRSNKASRLKTIGFAYFLLLGIGFMAVEMPLIQKFILLLGQPTYSFSAVLFTLLLSSGMGSLFSKRVNRLWILVLGALACLSPFLLTGIMNISMGWGISLRLLVTLLCLSPLGFLMGVPFPRGIVAIQASEPGLVPWLWAINGTASVIATVLAAIIAITFGFIPLLISGGICYLVAYGLLIKLEAYAEVPDSQQPVPSLVRS